MIGVSGTVTTVSAHHLGLKRYNRTAVDGSCIGREHILRICDELRSVGGRAHGPALHRTDRADLALAGGAILEAVCRQWQTPMVRVADRGLREGVLMDLMRQADREADPYCDPGIDRSWRVTRAAARPVGAPPCASRPRADARFPRSAGCSGSSTIPMSPKQEARLSFAAPPSKLLQLDDQFRFLKPAHCVVDLARRRADGRKWRRAGKTPAEWRQGDRHRHTQSSRSPAHPVGQDFYDECARGAERAAGGAADVVMSDMAASATGDTQVDHLRIIGLAEAAHDFARRS